MSRTTYTASMYGNERDQLAAQLLLFGHGFVLADLDTWLQTDDIAEAVRRHYQQAREELVQAVVDGNDAAAHAGVAHLGLVLRADRREQLLIGEIKKFHGKGKHPDAVGHWLDVALRQTPKATTNELWVLLTKKPPRGYVVEQDSFGGTLYRAKPWTQICTRSQWRDRVRRARERLGRAPAK